MKFLTPLFSIFFHPDFFEYYKNNYQRSDVYTLIITYCNSLKKLRHNGMNAIIVPTNDISINKQAIVQFQEFLEILRTNLFQNKTFEEFLIFSCWVIKQMKMNQKININEMMKLLGVEDYLSLSTIEIQSGWSDQDLKSLCKSLKHQSGYRSSDTNHNFTWNQLKSVESIFFDFSLITNESEKSIKRVFEHLEKLSNVNISIASDSTANEDCWLFNLLIKCFTNSSSLKRLSITSKFDIHHSFVTQLFQLCLESIELRCPSLIKLNNQTKISYVTIDSEFPLSIQFDKCKQIQSFSLENIPITINDFIRLLNNLPNLHHLTINNFIQSKRVLKTLPKTLNLVSLGLRGIDDVSIIELEPVLEHVFQKSYSTLKKLDLNYTFTGKIPQSLEKLTMPTLANIQLLSELKNLQSLEITKSVNFDSFVQLTKHIGSFPSSLRILDLILPQQKAQKYLDYIPLFFIELSLTQIHHLKMLNMEPVNTLFDFINCSTNLFSIQYSDTNVLHLWKNLSRL